MFILTHDGLVLNERWGFGTVTEAGAAAVGGPTLLRTRPPSVHAAPCSASALRPVTPPLSQVPAGRACVSLCVVGIGAVVRGPLFPHQKAIDAAAKC